MSQSTGSFKGWKELNRHHSSEFSDIQDIGYRYLRSLGIVTLLFPSRLKIFSETNETETIGNYSEFLAFLESRQKFNDRLDAGEYINDQRRLIEEMLDNSFYETNVHPRVLYYYWGILMVAIQKDYMKPTRVNLSMSLYQVLDVVGLLFPFSLESNISGS